MSFPRLLNPPAASLAHREHIARLVSPLKRVRPHVPFFQLAAHRVPTLWTLYRGLLKFSPNDDVRFRIESVFRRYRHLTSPRQTKKRLEKAYEWLDIFAQAHRGDEHLQAVLERYGKMIAAKRDKLKWTKTLIEARAEAHSLRFQPILTGTYMRPTIFNKPLPRLNPQPEPISMMIFKRRRARAARLFRQRALLERRQELKVEEKFEERLALESRQPFEHVFSGSNQEKWIAGIDEQLDAIGASYKLDRARAASPFRPEMVKKVEAAKVEKRANKLRERARELRGEELFATWRRRRIGYPAHVMAKWSPQERRERLIALKSIVKVGYIGALKRKFGWKIRTEEDQYGEEDTKRLEAAEMEIRRENLRRKLRAKVLECKESEKAHDIERSSP